MMELTEGRLLGLGPWGCLGSVSPQGGAGTELTGPLKTDAVLSPSFGPCSLVFLQLILNTLKPCRAKGNLTLLLQRINLRGKLFNIAIILSPYI